ncbi:hypothetical protein AGMMS49525_00980 [Bacteroidia bacterium]|nr:hypothetical protein AGMMS49525_00980 [Bacteroidia bacterium]
MQSLSDQIESEIIKKQKGEICFAEDFKKFGNAEVVRIALFRLCRKGIIVRLSARIYLYPKRNKDGDIIHPQIAEIIKQIAKRDNAKIIPIGLSALHALGLSTQDPVHLAFLSSNTTRTMKIGEVRVVFKQTEPKNLSYKSKVCSLAIFALKEIGKSRVQQEELQKIYDALSDESDEKIMHDAQLAPQWILDILMNYIKQRDSGVHDKNPFLLRQRIV